MQFNCLRTILFLILVRFELYDVEFIPPLEIFKGALAILRLELLRGTTKTLLG